MLNSDESGITHSIHGSRHKGIGQGNGFHQRALAIGTSVAMVAMYARIPVICIVVCRLEFMLGDRWCVCVCVYLLAAAQDFMAIRRNVLRTGPGKPRVVASI
jgi:hypothetical protein